MIQCVPVDAHVIHELGDTCALPGEHRVLAEDGDCVVNIRGVPALKLVQSALNGAEDVAPVPLSIWWRKRFPWEEW